MQSEPLLRTPACVTHYVFLARACGLIKEYPVDATLYTDRLPRDLMHEILKYDAWKPCHACPDCGRFYQHSHFRCMEPALSQLPESPCCESCARMAVIPHLFALRVTIQQHVDELDAMIHGFTSDLFELRGTLARGIDRLRRLTADERPWLTMVELRHLLAYHVDAKLWHRLIELRKAARELLQQIVQNKRNTALIASRKRNCVVIED